MAKQAFYTQHVSLSSCHASYALGLIDPFQVGPMLVEADDDLSFKLLVPGALPASMLAHPEFEYGAIDGYGDVRQEMQGTPAGVANWTWQQLREGFADTALPRPWVMGFILGALSYLAETDRALALVGIAHLFFLFPLVPPLSGSRLSRALLDADCAHDKAVRAYRARVRDMKAQGLDFAAASLAALAGLCHLHAPYADGSLSNALPTDESEVA